MASVKFIVKKQNVSKKSGLTPVYVQYNYSREKRIIINTKEKIELKYWDITKDRLKKGCPDYDSVNKQINKVRIRTESIVSEALDNGIDPTPQYVLDEYYGKKQEINTNGEKDFFFFFDQFVESKRQTVGKHTINDYNALKKHLTGFQKWDKTKIDFSLIDYSFYQKFVKYLKLYAVKPDKEKGLATNTVAKTVKNLKIFLRDCGRKKITEPIDLSDFKTYQEEVDNIYLNEDEIKKIYELDLSEDPEMDRIRDLFVLGCFTGLRYSDLSNIKPGNVKKEFLYIRQGKTMNNVVIPLNKVALSIINKYGGGIPEGIHMNEFNKHIKTIAKKAGIDEDIIQTKKKGAERVETIEKKYQLIASHTCRRSFCTNEYLKGTPPLFIMKISGHRSERNFLKYIKVDEQVAAEKMLEFWRSQENSKL